MKPDFKLTDGKWFRQCVGIDMSKEKFTACLQMYDILSDEGCNSNTVEFKNNRTGFNQLIRWSRKEALKDFPTTFLMEPTGVYYEGLANHLHKLGLTVFVVLPNKARDYARYNGIKTKTDEMDARCLALLGCENRKLRPWEPAKPVFRQLRQMTRFIEHMSDVRTMLANQQEAVEYTADCDKTIRNHFRKLIDEIDTTLEKNRKNIQKVVAADKELYECVKRLETIPGISFLTIVAILAETNGFELIRNCKQLVSYAGLDVVARQSGNEDPKHTISKKGNSHIRRVLYFPGITAGRCNEQIKQSYDRINAKNPHTKMKGVCAAMRQLLVLVYSMWKSGEVYNPGKTTAHTSRKNIQKYTKEVQYTPSPVSAKECIILKGRPVKTKVAGVKTPGHTR